MLWTLRVTGVYLRDIADTFCSVLHLNVSQNKRLFFLLDYNLLNPAKQKKKKKCVCVISVITVFNKFLKRGKRPGLLSLLELFKRGSKM